jgi:hypothetical protein
VVSPGICAARRGSAPDLTTDDRPPKTVYPPLAVRTGSCGFLMESMNRKVAVHSPRPIASDTVDIAKYIGERFSERIERRNVVRVMVAAELFVV